MFDTINSSLIPMPRSLLHAALSFPCEPSEPQESHNHDHCQHNQWPPPFPHHDHHPDYHHANVQFILSPLYAASSPPCEPSEPQECHCPSCPLPLWANFDDMISSFRSGGHNTKRNHTNSRRKTFFISDYKTSIRVANPTLSVLPVPPSYEQGFQHIDLRASWVFEIIFDQNVSGSTHSSSPAGLKAVLRACGGKGFLSSVID